MNSVAGEDPRREYATRLEARRATAARWAAQARAISHARLLLAAGVVLAWWALAQLGLSRAWLLLPVGVFLALILLHERARRAHTRAERAVGYYEHGLACLDDRFAGRGRGGEEFADASHPYALHLDVFGRGSLFERLSRAQTRAGEETLARWLCTPADPAEVRARQVAVAELRPGIDLRERQAVVGPEVRAGVHPEALAAWGAAPPRLAFPGLRWVGAALVALTTSALAAAIWGGAGLGPLLGALCLQGLFGLGLRSRVSGVLADVEKPARELGIFALLLEGIERERFEAPRLVELRAALQGRHRVPSEEIGRLRRLVDLLDARRNQLFAPISVLLLWSTQIAFAIEAWRRECGSEVARWLEVAGEFEALCDLASYAYECPADPFPELTEEGPRFEGEQIGHPLLPESRCVRNDLRLDPKLSLLVVSGSNMSGKSTLLRTVGVTVVLGLAGAPVRARRLVLSPLAIGASLRVQDSLQEGTSRFYAEIRGLHRAVELCSESRPVLFLFDEILQGTNSHDRRIGAAAVARGLVERGAVGLITTHDLALAEIANELAPRARNVHFQDQLSNGKMYFDYRLRDGVITKSNALALMRSVGLEV